MTRLHTQFKTTLILIILSSLSATTVFATIVPKMTFQELMDNSSLVFRGRVLATKNLTHTEDSEIPHTEVRFKIHEVLFGELDKKPLILTLPGGQRADKPDGRPGSYVQFIGAPIFTQGATYLVFLKDGDWQFTPVTNWSHGVFRESELNGERILVDQSGHNIQNLDQNGFSKGQRTHPSEQEQFAKSLGFETLDNEENADTYDHSNRATEAVSPNRPKPAQHVLGQLKTKIHNYRTKKTPAQSIRTKGKKRALKSRHLPIDRLHSKPAKNLARDPRPIPKSPAPSSVPVDTLPNKKGNN